MSLFSVIIPTYQRPDELRGCLQRLAPGTQSLSFDQYEVIVTDDEGEGSDTQQLVQEEFPWATWMTGPGRGVAANRNNGAQHAQNKWLVFTDDDCRPKEEWLSAYRETAERGDAKVLEGKTVTERERPGPGWTAPVNRTGGKLWSCNFAIRRRAYEEIGGFDERYPGAGVEDVDFRIRIQNRSIAIRFVPDATVHHPWRESYLLSGQITKIRAWRRFFLKFPEEAKKYNFNYHLGVLVGVLKWGGLSILKEEWRREAGVRVKKFIKSGIILYQRFKSGH